LVTSADKIRHYISRYKFINGILSQNANSWNHLRKTMIAIYRIKEIREILLSDGHGGTNAAMPGRARSGLSDFFSPHLLRNYLLRRGVNKPGTDFNYFEYYY